MTEQPGERKRFSRKLLTLPSDRLKPQKSQASERGHQFAVPTVPTKAAVNVEYQSVKGILHERLIDEMNDQNILAQSDDELESFVSEFVANVLDNEDWPLNGQERRRLGEDLVDETLGTGPLAVLMADPAVTDILVNRFDQVYIERFGQLEDTDVRFRDEEHLVRIIQRIAARVGRRIDTSSPMVDARLPDGSRVNATLSPITIDGPTLSIRRFGRKRLKSDELKRLGMFSPQMQQFFEIIVRERKNVLISGGTGSGKSTFLGSIAESIAHNERVITIEDAAELMLDQRHVIRMETRAPNLEGQGRISQRDLVINALRMRPDRIIVGEVRGGEALDMLQAMNTGHDGSLTTIHANSPRDAVSRLETMVMMAGMELPSKAIREQCTSALDFILHVRRFEDGTRRVERVSELVGMEQEVPQLQDIFVFERRQQAGKSTGQFKATGIIPRAIEELRGRGIDVPIQELFGNATR
ncbi:MAG: pilus assembly protein CpaF [Planctomycetaceae bacterium]|nr:pilus assembly protein CpaF [Planctomycetaceae bacterium]